MRHFNSFSSSDDGFSSSDDDFSSDGDCRADETRDGPQPPLNPPSDGDEGGEGAASAGLDDSFQAGLEDAFSSPDDDFHSDDGQRPLRYSYALEHLIADVDSNSHSTGRMGETQEDTLRNHSELIENMEVSFFCYLVVDPTMLPETASCSLRQFIRAIFYVGKGNRSRPLQHLVEAHTRRRKLAENPSHQMSDKVKRILSLWDAGHGVISLHISHNIHSEEAYTREAAMIEAIGIKNLTNLQKGRLNGIARTWTRRQLTEFGAMLLRKAHVVFQNERCRPVFEADIEGIGARFAKRFGKRQRAAGDDEGGADAAQ